jgi:hypothetical protein
MKNRRSPAVVVDLDDGLLQRIDNDAGVNPVLPMH